MDTVYPISGFIIGTIVGLTGVGGGSLMTPLLILAFGVAPATAIGTDLIYAAVTKSAGAVVHARRGNVDWKTTGWLAAGSVPAAAATLWALHALAANPKTLATILTTVLGFALFATAAALLLRRRLARAAAASRAGSADAPPPRASATASLGVVLGVLVTLSSVGAGALGTVALLMLFPRVATSRIVGTDIAHAVPLTLVAGLGHAALGGVDWALLASLLVGSIPGIWLGSHVANRVPERWLTSLLATLLVIVGARLVF
jgi:uncharacterized membrane protein YfcA